MVLNTDRHSFFGQDVKVMICGARAILLVAAGISGLHASRLDTGVFGTYAVVQSGREPPIRCRSLAIS